MNTTHHSAPALRSESRASLAAVFVALITIGLAGASAQTPQTAGQIAYFNGQINQLNVDIEAKKLSVLQAKTVPNNAKSVQMYEADIKRFQNTLAVRRMELTMWQQQATFEKQAPHANPEIQKVKAAIQQLTFEKSRQGVMQLQANQTNNKAMADACAAKMNQLQAQVTAKQQEIRLIEMKAKAAAAVQPPIK